ncbi:3-oxoacyl-[acyl-carrier-protein] reductase [Desulfacinum hydrothermale DSM 13146]|uniref:3-oxoacyl-[acyl-carrier-protein] reductase n=1 Tax=Desulfacinum hydrothermale DSM 13146 TaxID=1121390 RepID=A0A1W1X6R1_9BACT|nr:3-oxoacyl-[acyl-carrier-protein] reductase [Desulfacinum hydrothermale]SMC19622.1 3-oxoacyl-[acyl-carrier-protein] reductase [Desulfacinum hydrothermale DSM 13146]
MEHNKVVLVTGASRGIGRAVALAFAEPETTVVVNYRSGQEAAQETARAVEKQGGKAVLCPFDVADPDAVKKAFKEVVDSLGRLDVLVNNAGMTRDNVFPRLKTEDWDLVLDVNLKGIFLCSQAAVRPMLKQRHGRIINITSVVGFTGNPGQCNYAAAKAGIMGLTRSLARELISRNITVNAVAPGYIETEMTHALPEKAREALVAQIPAGRTGRPEEVAAAVRFLASEQAAYITGQVLHVNGGMYMG